MQAKQPPWPTVSCGVSVRGRRYFGTSICRSRATIWYRNGSPATKPTMETNQGAPECAAMNSSTSSKPLIRGRVFEVGAVGVLVALAEAHQRLVVHGSLY